MNLDDLERFKQIDRFNMIGEIEGLANQLAAAWALAQRQPLPSIDPAQISAVVIAGLGGSAIGGDLLATWSAAAAKVPIIVNREYGLPAFAQGATVLVIASSHSGNTEETLDAFQVAMERKCTLIAVTTGGGLAERAASARVPVWAFSHAGQPRAAVGYSFGLLLGLLARLGIFPDPSAEVAEAVQSMGQVRQKNGPAVPAALNPAKRYAGQLMGRWVTVFGAGLMAPVARRIKTQINEVAKAGANFEFIPEADHNALAGTQHPEEVLMPHMMNLFLRSPSDDPRNRRRLDLTKKAYMLEGLNTDFLDARGRSPMANIWTQILFGDYMAYYLAMGYGIDPTPVDALVHFKEAIRAGGRN